jgi:hypothetical protein
MGPQLMEKTIFICVYSKKYLKIFLSRTSRPVSIKLDTNYPYMKRIQVCSNKGPGPL